MPQLRSSFGSERPSPFLAIFNLVLRIIHISIYLTGNLNLRLLRLRLRKHTSVYALASTHA